MKRDFTACVWREEQWHVAQCLEVDIASQGLSRAEALIRNEPADSRDA